MTFEAKTTETVTSSGKCMRMTVIRNAEWEEQFYVEKMMGTSPWFVRTKDSMEWLRKDLQVETIFTQRTKDNLLENLDRIVNDLF